MKIIHIMKREKFTNPVVGFYNKYYNNGEHEILYVNYMGEESMINDEFTIYQSELFLSGNALMDAIKIIQYLNKSKGTYFVIHSLIFLNYATQFLLYTIFGWLFNKVVWIEWGADLYSWRSKNTGFKGKIKNHIGYNFRFKIKNFIAIFPADIEIYKSDFPESKARIFYAPYIGYPLPNVVYKSTNPLEEALKNKKEIVIQIGHNGIETLNHIDVLQNLAKYRDENIRIFMPLSYGGKEEYVNKVIECANELFPEKTWILKEFMPLEQYNKIVESVSIAIFHTYRQCALSNIDNLNLQNVKVYLTEQGAMYDYYAKNAVPIARYEDIQDMNFEQFIKPAKIENVERFDEYVNEVQTREKAIECWRYIYDTLNNHI